MSANRTQIFIKFNNLIKIFCDNSKEQFDQHLKDFKGRFLKNIQKCPLGMNIVLLGESGAGKSSFIKVFFASFGLDIEVLISHSGAGTKFAKCYHNSKYNINLIDTEGNHDYEDARTPDLIIEEALKVLRKINDSSNYPIPTIFIVCNPHLSKSRYEEIHYKYTVDMMKSLSKKKLLEFTYIMFTQIDKLSYIEDGQKTLTKYIKREEETEAKNFIERLNERVKTKLANFKIELQENITKRGITFDNFEHKLLLWSCLNRDFQQFDSDDYTDQSNHISFPFLMSTRRVIVPDNYFDNCYIPDIFTFFLDKLLEIQKNDVILTNLINLIIERLPFYRRSKIISFIKRLCIRLVNLFSNSNPDGHEHEHTFVEVKKSEYFNNEDDHDDYINIVPLNKDESVDNHPGTTAAGGGLRERRTAAGGGLNE